MPLFIAALIGGLVQAAGTLVGKVMLSLGIGYVAFTGVDASITFARDALIQSFQALPPIAFQVAGAMKLGVCVSIVTSALIARMTLNGLTSGTIKKMVVK